ncbi:MAG TPA: response regulator transcription factor [Casimicrobiaceae bacterium]|nr:response regulator transcription factor [Casimicrobiaceae bacterium]
MEANQPIRIYIVEDSQQIRTRLHEMLTRLGRAEIVGEAENAHTAIDEILSLRPDIVILDFHLPGASGVQVLREVHPKAPATMFVMLTNYPNAQYRRICLEAGASHFLDKSNEFMKINELVAGYREQRCSAA